MSRPPTPPASQPSPASEEPPGLPGLSSWHGVYSLVLAAFAGVVLLLVWFGAHFT